jgi:DNA polymerase-3 subunit beta
MAIAWQCTALLTTPSSETLTAIIPAKTLTEIAKLVSDEVETVWFNLLEIKNQIAFVIGNTTVISQLIDGAFPDYTQIIPKMHTSETTVYVSEFLRACKLAEVHARDSANTVRVGMTPPEGALAPGMVPGLLKVTGVSQERGDSEWEMDCNGEGNPVEAAYNVKYLNEGLNAIPTEQVLWETAGPTTPGVFKPVGMPEGSEYLYVVMPMSTHR